MYLCNLDLSHHLLFTHFHTKTQVSIHHYVALISCCHAHGLDLQYYNCGATNKRGSNLEALSLSFFLLLSLCVWFNPFLSLFALDCSPFSCTPLTPTHTSRNIRQHSNNSSQVQFCCMIYSWLHASLTLIFLLLMSFFKVVTYDTPTTKKPLPPNDKHGIVSYQKQQRNSTQRSMSAVSVLFCHRAFS